MKHVMMVLAVASAFAVEAKVKLATPFNDNMVLQRDRPVRVWGTADPGETVTVTYAGATFRQSRATTACKGGKWMVELAPMKACKCGGTLTVNDVALKDVLVGEVWMCAGQSNTDCPVWGGNPRYRDGQGAMHIQMTVKPWVRLVKTPRQWDVKPKLDYRAQWVPMTPALLKQGSKPSAMGWYYALELANALDIPVGLVDSSVGGTNIDSWTPKSGLASRPDLKDVLDWPMVDHKGWKDTMRKGPIGGGIQQPTALWNGMVAAYAPMSIRGFIWYQGCHNAGEWPRYCSKMHALYNGWATEFKNPDLKLYFAQLAPWGYNGIATIQQAQAQFAAEEKNAAMAVINDVGNLADIHPNDKRTVAKRLALHALKRDYGYDWLVDNSPTLKSWKIEGDAFVLSFDDAKEWYVYNMDRSVQTGFEIAGADGKFVPAKIANLRCHKDKRSGKDVCDGCINGATLVVKADGVTAPVKLRYLYSRPWFGCLYNEVNLPLGAFHIGD